MDESRSISTSSDPWSNEETEELEDPTIFKAGDLVNERYRILRFIDRGGAAEVYEARDEELDHRLALKALRRNVSKARVVQRFKREINLARQVTHPNVCRLYDFDTEGDVLFLTMELLDGETLLERVRRSGPMTAAEVLPLARQMAIGLDAAHEAGVIHRDFKSGNVMLVKAEGFENGVRAVITDFGLAKAAAEEDLGPRVTAHDTLVGTPAYMAPEQVENTRITPATDLYAFGVVLYEMLTGRYPFESNSSLSTAIMRLREDPVPPTVHMAELDPRWEGVVLRCLERDPDARFPSAQAAVTALEQEAAAAEIPVRRRGGQRQSWPLRGERLPKNLLALAAVVLMLAGIWAVGRWLSRGDGALGLTARRSVAILGFDNLAERADVAWLSTALSEMLAAEVAAGEKLRVIPGDNVAQTKAELGLDENDSLDPETLARVGEILGTDQVIEGSFFVAGEGLGQEIRLDIRIRQIRSGEFAAMLSERGTVKGVLDLVESMGRSLREQMGVDALSVDQARAVRAAHPDTPESAELYARGLEQMRLFNVREALEHFEAAAESDPDNALIHSAVASAWSMLGYERRALESARLASSLAIKLGRREQRWVEARYYEIAGERQKAVDNYTLLWDFFPDNLEYGLRLATAQVELSEGDAALATVARLRALPETLRMDPRIDLAEAEAARVLSRYDLQRDRAVEAARKGEALGARHLVARARDVEAGALRDLGEHEAALEAYDEARTIYEEAHDRGKTAWAVLSIARIHRHQGHFDQARELSSRALAIAQEIGNQDLIKQNLGFLAILLRQQGQLSEAQNMHEMELAAHRETGARREEQITLTNLGIVKRRQGELAAARAAFEEALAMSREMNNQRSIAVNLNMLGQTLLIAGRVAEAEAHFEEALEVNKITKSPRGRAYYVTALGDVALVLDDLTTARERYEDARAVREELGEKTNVAVSNLALARLALEERDAAGAAELARRAAAEFRLEGRPNEEGQALALEARAQAALGEIDGAVELIHRAEELLEPSEDRELKFQVARLSAEVAAERGRVSEARRQLRRLVDDTSELGFVNLALEARLALGTIELVVEPAAGRPRLEALATDADAHGFLRIARQARFRLSAN